MTVSKRVVLHFPKELVDQPIVCRLAREFDLDFNILRALVTPEEEGLLVLELSGEEKDYERGIRYLTEVGVKIQPLGQNITRNEEKCPHCGACVTICPVGAFTVHPLTREVEFSDARCIACGLCVKACPYRAMEVRF